MSHQQRRRAIEAMTHVGIRRMVKALNRWGTDWSKLDYGQCYREYSRRAWSECRKIGKPNRKRMRREGPRQYTSTHTGHGHMQH